MIYVSKFGSSIIKDETSFDKVEDFLSNNPNTKHIIIVSAFKNKTDYYLSKTSYLDLSDAIAALGELESGILLTSYLKDKGYNAIFLNAYQIPIITTDVYGDAEILYLGIDQILKTLKRKDVLVIPGFLGITKDLKQTTLGRGGSDYTAIYIASELEKKGYKMRCHLFKDKDYILNHNKKPVKKISYQTLSTLIKNNAPISLKALNHAASKKIIFSIGKNDHKKTIVSSSD